MCVPIEIVIDRVVNALLILAGKADIQRGYAEMVKECREVGARAERIDAQVWPLSGFFLFVSRSRFDLVCLLAFPYGDLLLRILNIPRNFVDKCLEGIRAAGIEKATRVSIAVD